jgi:glycosyltransferase involved in cell wall biosynthesis/SAM-dependent methyltransferase
MKVVVLTTSYPRGPDDVAGAFVRDAVEHLRAAGVEVDVVSPASFRHFGLAYGHGIVGNLKRRPWKVLLVPLFLASYARAARRAARDADLVHAHWLPSALPAVKTRKPFVLQLWGTDVELARRARWVARTLVRRARVVLCPSEDLAQAACELGARDVRLAPGGVTIPAATGEPDDPPHALFVGRLSEEKGILDFVEATDGMPRVIVGDGPLRARAPGAVGFVPPAQVGAYYERAAVVVCPSHREGYGIAAREAMAHGRPVVACAVGGLLDAVEEGVTGLLVPARDPTALRAAIDTLLSDAGLRARLGDAARIRAARDFSWAAATERTIAAYDDATRASTAPETLDEMLAAHERAWDERPLLRRLYRDWFVLVASRMSTVAGPSIELGSGIGRFAEACPRITKTDIEPTRFAEAIVDAERLPYEDGKVANLVLIDVFHHIADPARFLNEATRVLRPGGRVVILDPYCSPVSGALYRRFHTERTDLDADPFADDPAIDAAPFDSNQARATLAFFRALSEFEARWPQLRVCERRRLALFAYPLSGGFTRRPLAPDWLGAGLQRIEPSFSWFAPALAFRCLVVLERSGAALS